MQYAMKKIIEVSNRKLDILGFDRSKIYVKNGFLYCYLDPKQYRLGQKNIFRLGSDKSVILKSVLGEEETGYCQKLIVTNEAIYHPINGKGIKPYIIIEDKDLNRLSVYQPNESVDMHTVYVVDNDIYYTGIHEEAGAVLCKSDHSGRLLWHYPVCFGEVFIPLENGKVMISALRDFCLVGYHIIDKDGHLDNIIQTDESYVKEPIKDEHSGRVLIHGIIPWSLEKQYILHRVIILDSFGQEISRVDIKNAAFIHHFFDDRYIIHYEGLLNGNLYLYDLVNKINIAKIPLSSPPPALTFIHRIKEHKDYFVIILSKENCFEVLCLDKEFQQIWKFAFKGDLVDADFVNGFLFFITNTKAGIHQLTE